MLNRFEGPVRFGVDLLTANFIRLEWRAARRLTRFAAVGGPAWWGVAFRVLNPLLRVTLRRFDAEDEAAAWDWIGAQPAEASAGGAA